MNYLHFFFKKVNKNSFTLVILIITLLALCFSLVQNMHAQELNSIKTTTTNELTLAKQHVAENKNLIKTDTFVLEAIKAGQWQAVYPIAIQKSKADLRVANEDPNETVELKTAILRTILRYKFLKAHNLPESSESYPVQGISFSVSLSKYLIPVLFTLIFIFVLVQAYTQRFIKNIDRDSLIPTATVDLNVLNIVGGMFVVLVLAVLLILPIFIIASLFFGIGSPNDAFFTYKQGTMIIQYRAIKSILPTLLGLQLLSLVFTIVLTYLLSIIVKQRFSTLFITTLLVLGTAILTKIIEPLQRIAQYLPTTYLFSQSVVSGEYAESVGNFAITSTNGYLVLFIWIVLVSVGISIYSRTNFHH